MPVPVSGMRPAAIRACWSWSLRSLTRAADPWPSPSMSPICARSSQDRSLSSSCWAWSPVAVSTSGVAPGSCSGPAGPRRPAGRRSRKPEAEQRRPEGDLPARDGPHPGQHGHAVRGVLPSTPCRTGRRRPRRTATTDHGEDDAARHRHPSRGVRGPAGRHGRGRQPGAAGAAACPVPGRRPSPAAPGRAAPAAGRSGSGRRRRGRPARRRRTRPRPGRSRFVNASSSVWPSAYERISDTSAS